MRDEGGMIHIVILEGILPSSHDAGFHISVAMCSVAMQPMPGAELIHVGYPHTHTPSQHTPPTPHHTLAKAEMAEREAETKNHGRKPSEYEDPVSPSAGRDVGRYVTAPKPAVQPTVVENEPPHDYNYIEEDMGMGKTAAQVMVSWAGMVGTMWR